MTHYLPGHSEAVTHAHAGRAASDCAPHLLPHLRPGLKLLDIGSASGQLTQDLAARVAPGPVTGIDLAAEAVQAAQADPARPANLDFRVADAYALPFDDGTFDVVHVHQVLHHLADPPAALREAARVARPGGLLALREADFAAAFWFPACSAWEEWRAVCQQMGGAEDMATDAGRRLPAWLVQAGLAEAAEPENAAAGGPEIQISSSTWTDPGFAPPAEIARSWTERLTGHHLADRAAADRAALAATAQGLIEWARQPTAFFAMPHIEALVRLPA
ncbi:MAG: methyltransferase domain-containing protein [Propionibacteriaceae bacterium]|nr:methyltransferase domain-containing protein [Propionibacteriaceae bacterium]